MKNGEARRIGRRLGRVEPTGDDSYPHVVVGPDGSRTRCKSLAAAELLVLHVERAYVRGEARRELVGSRR